MYLFGVDQARCLPSGEFDLCNADADAWQRNEQMHRPASKSEGNSPIVNSTAQQRHQNPSFNETDSIVKQSDV